MLRESLLLHRPRHFFGVPKERIPKHPEHIPKYFEHIPTFSVQIPAFCEQIPSANRPNDFLPFFYFSLLLERPLSPAFTRLFTGLHFAGPLLPPPPFLISPPQLPCFIPRDSLSDPFANNLPPLAPIIFLGLGQPPL